MAIEIVDSPDPLSEASLRRYGASAEPLLVESSASRILRQELQRYCRGMINGRSFLIAGHRGAGKTTLVAKAFMDVWRESEKGGMLRALFIPLHGPSLFPTAAARAATENTKDDAKPKSDSPLDRCARPAWWGSVLNAAATNPMENYSDDTIELVRDWFDEWDEAARRWDRTRERCQELAAHPPADWQGVYEMKTK
jgi:hypothetical protein